MSRGKRRHLIRVVGSILAFPPEVRRHPEYSARWAELVRLAEKAERLSIAMAQRLKVAWA